MEWNLEWNTEYKIMKDGMVIEQKQCGKRNSDEVQDGLKWRISEENVFCSSTIL